MGELLLVKIGDEPGSVVTLRHFNVLLLFNLVQSNANKCQRLTAPLSINENLGPWLEHAHRQWSVRHQKSPLTDGRKT